MSEVNLVIKPRWVIPVSEDNVVLDEHCVAVTESRIAAILPAADAQSQFPTAELLELPGHALLPGFINAHTHAAMTLLRGYADDLPLQSWLHEHIWPAESRWVGTDFVRDGVRLAIAEMIAGGTTCFSDMYYFPDVAAAVAVESGMRAVIGMIIIAFPSRWAGDIDDYFRKGERVHDQFSADPLITTIFAPHAPYSVDDNALARISRLAEEMDVGVTMHVQETRQEVQDALDQNGERPIQRLHRHGLLSPRLLAIHMTTLNDSDIEAVAHNGVHVIHCPESNLKLASGICPVEELRVRGINVALGTDGAASNNDLDMLGEMRTAALLAKSTPAGPTAVPAEQALRMATINAATALGLADEIGSLETGKQADMIAIDLNRPATQPIYHPISQIVYAASRDQVSDVWIAGRRVLADGVLQSVDAGAAVDSAAQWQQRMSAPD